MYLCYYDDNKSFRGGVFIRTKIRELEIGIEACEAGLLVIKGFIFLEGKRINAKGGRLIEKGGDMHLLLNGNSFGGGTLSAGIVI